MTLMYVLALPILLNMGFSSLFFSKISTLATARVSLTNSKSGVGRHLVVKGKSLKI